MVDWLIQVFGVISQLKDKTLFITVSLLDNFLSNLKAQKVSFPHSYLYLMGATCLFIAAKYDEVESIGIEMLIRELGHDQFTQDEVLQMEKKILENVNYRIPINSVYEETNILLASLISESPEKIEESDLEVVKDLVAFYTKLSLYDYNLAY